jgi:hypothetical protein
VAASQVSSGRVEWHSWSGLKVWMPHSATFGMSGSPWPVRAAMAMAWKPGYWLAGVPMSGWESIHRMARSSR